MDVESRFGEADRMRRDRRATSTRRPGNTPRARPVSQRPAHALPYTRHVMSRFHAAGGDPYRHRPSGPHADASASRAPIVIAQEGSMDRLTWLGQRHAAVLTCYDRQAPSYDTCIYPARAQHQWVARLL